MASIGPDIQEEDSPFSGDTLQIVITPAEEKPQSRAKSAPGPTAMKGMSIPEMDTLQLPHRAIVLDFPRYSLGDVLLTRLGAMFQAIEQKQKPYSYVSEIYKYIENNFNSLSIYNFDLTIGYIHRLIELCDRLKRQYEHPVLDDTRTKASYLRDSLSR